MKTAEDILLEKSSKEFLSIPREASLFEAIQKMTANKVGAIVVLQNNLPVGIWTERDLLRNILLPDMDLKTSRISDYMSSPLYSAPHDTSLEKLQDMFLGLYIRHIMIKKDDTYIGMVSIGDVMRASLLEKKKEIESLNKIASWEYYENWGWHKKYQEPKDKNNK